MRSIFNSSKQQALVIKIFFSGYPESPSCHLQTYPWERLLTATFDLAAGSRSHIQHHLFILDNQIFFYYKFNLLFKKKYVQILLNLSTMLACLLINLNLILDFCL
jgi:hypothetical protein